MRTPRSLTVFILGLVLSCGLLAGTFTAQSFAAVGNFVGQSTPGNTHFGPMAVNTANGDYYVTNQTANVRANIDHFDSSGNLLGTITQPNLPANVSGGGSCLYNGTPSVLHPRQMAVEPSTGDLIVYNFPPIPQGCSGVTPAVYQLSSTGDYLSTSSGVLTAPPTTGDFAAFEGMTVNPTDGNIYALWVGWSLSTSTAVDATVQITDSGGTVVDSFNVDPTDFNDSTFSVKPIGVDGSTNTVFLGGTNPSTLDPEIISYRNVIGWTQTTTYQPDWSLLPTAPWGHYAMDSLAVDSTHGVLHAALGTGGNLVTAIMQWSESGGNVLGFLNGSNTSAGYFWALDESGHYYANGVAADSSTGSLLVSDQAHGVIDRFAYSTVPDAATGSATAVNPSQEDVTGSVNPRGQLLTNCEVEYGTTSSYGQSAPCDQSVSTIGNGQTYVSVTASLTTNASTLYHYRVRSTNSNGFQAGYDKTFTTAAASAPTINTQLSSGLTSSSAALTANITPNYAASSYYFEYGTTTSYGQTTTIAPVPGTDGSGHTVSQAIGGLLPGQLYHWRTRASNSAGSTTGTDQTFTTEAAAPVVSNLAVSNISATSADVSANVNASGADASCNFVFTWSGGGTTVPCSPASVTGNTDTSVSAHADSLPAHTPIQLEVQAANSVGNASASTGFTTRPFPPAFSGLTSRDVQSSRATLVAQLDPQGVSTNVHFEYGTSTAYGLSTPTVTVGSAGEVGFTVGGLVASTAYDFRVVGESAGGQTVSENASFTTAAATTSTGGGNSTQQTPFASILSKPREITTSQSASFVFGGISISSYRCQIDSQAARACDQSPTFTGLQPGWHELNMWGVTADGAYVYGGNANWEVLGT